MIQAGGEVWSAVHQPSVDKSSIVATLDAPVPGSSGAETFPLNRWKPKLSSVTWRAGILPEGWKPVRATLTLANIDHELDPWSPGGFFGRGYLANENQELLNGKAKVTVQQYIRGPSGGLYPVPVFVGVIRDISWDRDLYQVQLTLQDRLSYSLNVAAHSSFTFDRAFNLLDNGAAYLRDFAGLDTATEVNTARAAFLFAVLDSLEWYGAGRIPEKTTVLNAYNAICRSCACQPFMTEDGKLDWVHEWPNTLPEGTDVTGELGAAITDRVANFAGVSRVNGQITSIGIDYQEVSQQWDLGKDLAAFASPNVLSVAMPYVQTGRQVATVRALYANVAAHTQDVLAFRSVGLGLLLQLGDVITVNHAGREQKWRVLTKRWTEDYVDIECVPYWQATVKGYTDWGEWETGGWSVRWL